MKKAEIIFPQALAKEEIVKADEDARKYTPALSLIPSGLYTIERMAPNTRMPAVYPVPYIGNDGVERNYYAFCLEENNELVPVSSFVKRYINVDGRIVVSPGFYDSYDSLLKCVETIAASSGKFMLRHVKGVWADGKTYKKSMKAVVTPIE